MKKIFTNLFLLATLFLASTNLTAQVYVINDPAEVKWGSNKSKEFDFEGRPCNKLTFSAKRDATGVGTLHVAQYVNGTWEDIWEKNPGKITKTFIGIETAVDYENYSCDINTNATKIKFYTNTITYNKFFKDVKVTMATYADAPDATEWTAPTATVGSPDESASTTMEWCNTSAFTFSLSGDGASQFTYSISNNASAGNYGTATISATYKHNIVGTHNATLTITTALGTHTIKLSGTTTKKNSSITWNLTETKLPKGKIVENAAKANSGNTVTYTTSNDTVIKVINDGTALQAVGLGTAEITATVAENDEWFGASDKKTFTVTNKTIQTIAWNDNLTRLKIGDEQITLSASVYLLVDAETNEKAYSE